MPIRTYDEVIKERTRREAFYNFTFIAALVLLVFGANIYAGKMEDRHVALSVHQ